MEKLNVLNLLSTILKQECITQTMLAEKLSITKQYLSKVMNGNKNLSSTMVCRLRELYPTYFDIHIDIPNEVTGETLKDIRQALGHSQASLAKYLDVSQSLIAQSEKNTKKTIPPLLINKLKKINNDKSNSSLVMLRFNPEMIITSSFDKTYHTQAHSLVHFDSLLIPNGVNINSCEIVSYGSGKIIIDWSKNKFEDNQDYLFRVNNLTYIAKVKLYPNKTKCTTLDNERFCLTDNNYEVFGQVVLRLY